MDDNTPSESQDWSSDSSDGASLHGFGEYNRTQDSAIHKATTRKTSNSPLPERVLKHPAKRRHPSVFGLPSQPASTYVGVMGDARAYAPNQPFEEAGPTSSIWRAYLDESLIYDTDMLGNQRGQVNILLVFAGLFSAIVSAFIAQSAGNLRPDYQQLSALLLFDQINIQRALANGTSIDRIITSGADPTAHFTPKPLDSWINGLWFSSLSLSLATALFAVLADEWYCHYLSPVAGDPQVRSRTRHLRYIGLVDWRVSTLIGLLPLMLHLSLGLFFIGLFLYLLPQQLGIALMIGTISLVTYIVYLVTNMLPLIYPECPYKTPLSSIAYVTAMWIFHRYTLVIKAMVSADASPQTLEGFEIYAAERSRVKYDLQALLWLYARSSTSLIRRLVIQALAGLPGEYNTAAQDFLQPHWHEILDEKEGMLMDCMDHVIYQGGNSTRWVPKNVGNVDHRLEQLLRLEIQFPALRREPLLGGYNLDFSNKYIYFDGLSTTLSSLEATHILKPAHLPSQKQVALNALALNDVHHPAVWNGVFLRAVDQGLFSRASDTVLNIDMCFSLVASLFLGDRASTTSYGKTLADTAVEYFPDKVLDNLLSFFENFDLYQVSMERHPRLLLAMIRLLVLNSEHPKLNFIDIHSSQRRFFHSDSTIAKYRLLIVALYAISRGLHDPNNPPLPLCHRGVFEAVLSYITSDLFIGTSTRFQNGSDYRTLVWTCRAHALACIAWFIKRGPDFGLIVPVAEWATRPLFSNLLRVMAQSDEYYKYNTQRLPHQRFGSLFGVISFLLGQGLSGGIYHAYETFQHERSLEYIAQRSSLHIWFIESLQGYITLLSKVTDGSVTGNHTGIEPEALQSHIEDIHQAPVILAICTSIALNGTPQRPLLSALAQIAPDHPEWNALLSTVARDIDNDALLESYYSDSREVIPPVDAKRLRKSLKVVVDVLTECVRTAKDHNSGIYRPLMSYPDTGSLETHHESRWRRWRRRVTGSKNIEMGIEMDAVNMDIEGRNV